MRVPFDARADPSDRVRVDLRDRGPGGRTIRRRRAGARGAPCSATPWRSPSLERGVGLERIAAVLRHATLDSTEIYAKVDRRSLATIATRWPRTRVCRLPHQHVIDSDLREIASTWPQTSSQGGGDAGHYRGVHRASSRPRLQVSLGGADAAGLRCIRRASWGHPRAYPHGDRLGKAGGKCGRGRPTTGRCPQSVDLPSR